MEETNYKTVEEVRNLIGVYNRILNIYNQTLNKGLVSTHYLVNPAVWHLRDYHLVKPAFEKKILELQDELITFQKDFYEFKSVAQIAERTGLSMSLITRYLRE